MAASPLAVLASALRTAEETGVTMTPRTHVVVVAPGVMDGDTTTTVNGFAICVSRWAPPGSATLLNVTPQMALDAPGVFRASEGYAKWAGL